MMNIIKKQALVLMAFAAVQGIQAQTGIEVPYIQNLESYQDFFTMKIVDANNDGNTFEYWSYKNVAQYMPNNNNADDWLITPPIKVKKGKVYTINADDAIKAMENVELLNSNDSSENADDNQSANNSSDNTNLQSQLENKTNEAIDKLSDKVSKKVEDKLTEKLEELNDSSNIDKIVDKILSLF